MWHKTADRSPIPGQIVVGYWGSTNVHGPSTSFCAFGAHIPNDPALFFQITQPGLYASRILNGVCSHSQHAFAPLYWREVTTDDFPPGESVLRLHPSIEGQVPQEDITKANLMFCNQPTLRTKKGPQQPR